MGYRASIAKGGNLLQLHGVMPETTPPKRGEITGFSASSRRRLIKELQSIDRTRSAPVRLFVTLTYPRFFPADSSEWKRHLDKFRKRLHREFDVQFAYWKLEPQRRGAPHFHLLIFLDREIPLEWLSHAWYECVGSGSRSHLLAGTQVQRMNSWNGVAAYTSKYVAKTVNGHDLPEYWHGIKWWGRWGAPPITLEEQGLSRAEFIQLRRLVTRYARSKGLRLKRRSGAAGRFLSGMTLFAPQDVGEALTLAAVQIATAQAPPHRPQPILTRQVVAGKVWPWHDKHRRSASMQRCSTASTGWQNAKGSAAPSSSSVG